MKKQSGFEIKPEERQNWVSIAFVWIGSVICVPALMIGGMLGAGLTLIFGKKSAQRLENRAMRRFEYMGYTQS